MRKVILCLVIVVGITGCSVKKIEEQKDAEKFAIEYNISEENPFHYISIDEVLSLLSSGNGILFLGNSDGEWSRLCVKILNDAFLKTKVEEVSYFNLKTAKEEYPKRYQKLIQLIQSQLTEEEKIQTPAIFFIKNGEIISYSLDYEEITQGNKEGYTEKKQKNLRKKYIQLIEEYQQKVS